jgi:hypothetical protein
MGEIIIIALIVLAVYGVMKYLGKGDNRDDWH